jgi:hypothetical protein
MSFIRLAFKWLDGRGTVWQWRLRAARQLYSVAEQSPSSAKIFGVNAAPAGHHQAR